MARKGKEEPEEVPGDDSPGTPEGADAAAEAAEQSEDLGPMEDADVETSLSDADRAFLDGVSAGEQPAPAPAAPPEPGAEHLEDLRRLTAEYANYRRRVERDRVTERERAVGDAVRVVLPVLDDLDRAAAHGDLPEGGVFATIASKLRSQVAKLGLSPFGEVGERFDPQQHDAIFQRPNPEVTEQTVSDVVERGYRIGDTTLRVAKVVVDTPEG